MEEIEIDFIPEGWCIMELDDLGDLQYGYTQSANQEIVGPKFLRITDIDLTYSKIKWEEVPYCTISENDYEKFMLKNGDILFARIGGTTGKTCIIKNPPKGVFASYLIRIVVNTEVIDPEFLFFFTISKMYWNQINKCKDDKLKKGVSSSQLKKFKIICPPLPEQQKIASILSSIQQAKELAENVIYTSNVFKKSMMKHLLTYGPVSLEETEDIVLKETEIGIFPEEWLVVKLEDVANINIENRNPKKEIPDEFFKYIDIASIEGKSGRIIDTKKIQGEKAPSRARRVVRTNDVILSTVRPYLKAFTIIPEEYDNEICSTGFAVLRSKDNILPKFLLYISFSDFVAKQFENRMRGSNYPALNAGHVKNTKITLPSLEIQKKISSILSEIDKKIEKEINKKRALEELFKSMLHNLMKGQIRVNHMEV